LLAGGALLLLQLLTREKLQKIARSTPCHLRIWRQVAVERMRNLVGIVADATELREQGGVHTCMSAGFDFDLAMRHESLAKTGDG